MHTRKALESLSQNKEAASSELYIYIDAPKKGSSAETIAANEDVKKIIREKNWCGTVYSIERENNLGLAASVIDGVTKVIEKHGKAIVLEDDLVVSPFFLQYMNAALDKYAQDDKVISIHGYTYPVSQKLPETFFLRGADCWGWATWKRGWDLFNADGSYLLQQIQKQQLIAAFNFNHTFDYMKMLQLQVQGKNSSWAVRWYASAFLQGKLTLYPGKSLVQNTGTDGGGTHVGSTEKYKIELQQQPVMLNDIPVEHNNKAFTAFADYFRATHHNALSRLLMKIKYNLPL